VRPPINVAVWEGPASAAPAVLIHGTFTWGSLAFELQRPLAQYCSVLVPDRRGFGASPDLDEGDVTSDYTVDAADVVGLMTGGVHLVGHSYGGTVAMLAAAARPELVRSLTLIEPCAHTVASGSPVVAAAIEDARRFMAGARQEAPEEYVNLAYQDRPRPEPAAWLLRAARTALRERPCWLADLATEPLAAGDFPKLVIVGSWETVPAGYRPGMAKVMQAVSEAVAGRIGARLVRVPGAAHEPQREQPERVNELLANFWSTV
jgi:pimeloyl-ACP methyl ester carboxylesterase